MREGDENGAVSANNENDGVFEDLPVDADELHTTSSSDDLVTSASSESEIESSAEDLQQRIYSSKYNEASASTIKTEERLYEGSKLSKVL